MSANIIKGSFCDGPYVIWGGDVTAALLNFSYTDSQSEKMKVGAASASTNRRFTKWRSKCMENATWLIAD